MTGLNIFGASRPRRPHDNGPTTEHVLVRRPLDRVLAFRGRTIDDVVNNPVVKNEVYGYWKLHKQILRTSEVVDLERQWNRRARRK